MEADIYALVFLAVLLAGVVFFFVFRRPIFRFLEELKRENAIYKRRQEQERKISTNSDQARQELEDELRQEMYGAKQRRDKENKR